jgi:hypothetical protein
MEHNVENIFGKFLAVLPESPILCVFTAIR